jgi:hypothetical protein
MHADSRPSAAGNPRRDRIRGAAQRRGKIGILTFSVLWIAMCTARLSGFDFLAWCLAPFVAAAFAFTMRTIVLTSRLRVQHQREVDEREVEAARRVKLRQQLHTLAAPDAVDGQCPVCGLDDLEALAAVDAELEEGADSRFLRVKPYGKRRAHAECAELVPYKPRPAELAIAAHELDHHGHPGNFLHSCPLCAKESIELLANDPDLDQPPPPSAGFGVTMAELDRALRNAFRLQPMILGDPMRVTEITEREARAQLEELARRERALFKYAAAPTVDRRPVIRPGDTVGPWVLQGLPPGPRSEEKGDSR